MRRTENAYNPFLPPPPQGEAIKILLIWRVSNRFISYYIIIFHNIFTITEKGKNE